MKEKEIIKLKNLLTLEVEGEGSKDLLQGQITCDMDKIVEKSSSLGALCNIKGRVISSFIVILADKNSERRYYLVGDKEMILKTKQVLTKYSPFYDVNLTIKSELSYYAVTHNDLSILFPQINSIKNNTIRLKHNIFLHYLKRKFSLILAKKDSPLPINFENSLENQKVWELDQINNLNVEITQEISEKYTPHELNYDLTERVDFEKGCYTGQEVVAKMQYRAKKIPRLMLAESKNLNLESNMPVYNENGLKVGNLVKEVIDQGKSICLISVKEDFLKKSLTFEKGGKIKPIKQT